MFHSAQQASIEKAKELLANKKSVILHLDAINPNSPSFVHHAAIIELTGTKLLDTLIDPEQNLADLGISNRTIRTADKFNEVYPLLLKCIKGRNVICYPHIEQKKSINPFEHLSFCCRQHQLTDLREFCSYDCITPWFQQYVNEWDENLGNFRLPRIPRDMVIEVAMEQNAKKSQVSPNKPSAKCFLTLKIIRAMAEERRITCRDFF